MVTILIADDSLYMRTVLKKIASESGHKVIVEAKTVDEAIEINRQFKPVLVLLDIVMPPGNLAKNGVEAIKKIIAENSSVNILMCSSLGQQVLIGDALKSGAKGFIVKPFEPKRIVEGLNLCLDLGVFSEIGTIGSGHATTALSEIVHERITVEVPRVHFAPPHLVPKIYERHEQPTAVVYMRLEGEYVCDIMLAFEAEEAKKIAALMTMTSSPEEMDPEMEKSAIEELGSIMICSFLSAMADFAEIKFIPTPPQLVIDSFDAIIDGFLANQALTSDIALIFCSRFKRGSSSADGFLVVFPSLELQKLLVEKGRKLLDFDTKVETDFVE